MDLVTRHAVVALLAATLGAGNAVDAEPPQRERLEDPPGAVGRTEQTRSAAAVVVRGHHRSVQVNLDAAGLNIVGDAANEPSLAVDPSDPTRMVIGWRQFDTVTSNFRQAGYAFSSDAGASWTFPGVLQPGQFRSDPVLAADSSGSFFYYSLSTLTAAQMFISHDGGSSWSGPIAAFGGDKTWMGIDTTGGLGNDNIYAIWNSQFTCCSAGTDFTRSVDGGLTYQGPWALPEKPKWGTLDVGPDGELYIVGTRLSDTTFFFPQMILRSSNARDPLQTPAFELVRGIDLGGETSFQGTPNPGGLLGQVGVAVDRSDGPTRGYVYVLGSVDPPGFDPLDVMVVRSTDGGATWSAPRRVHDDPLGTAYQWFGTLSVAPDGRIDVIWNDTRNGPQDVFSVVYYAYSGDAGDNWSAPLPVTPRWNSLVGHPNQNKIGDYYHMISDVDGASLAYSATFNNEQDVYFLRVGDCNANGTHDAEDIAVFASEDCNTNGVPDECEEIPPCTSCDLDGSCDPGESCFNCAEDCPPTAEGCGNAICEPSLGEDCLSCPADCNGVQIGSPGDRFCCGDGDGALPVGCFDARCSTAPFACSNMAVPAACCGDGFCATPETVASCPADCEFADGDQDGARDPVDCAPLDGSTFAAPPEIGGLRFADASTLAWDPESASAGSGLMYQVVRGLLLELPVGGGGEICLQPGTGAPQQVAADDPAVGTGWYYLVRGINGCGVGTYGADSLDATRMSGACDF